MFTRKQSGNVLFLILIAVTLFAALSYAVTTSTRMGGGSISTEKDTLQAASLIQWADGLANEVMRKRLTEQVPIDGFNFNHVNSSYNQPCASGDSTCSIFYSEGGNYPPYSTTVDFMQDIADCSTERTQTNALGYAAVDQMESLGTDAPEIVYIVNCISDGICKAVNKKMLGVDEIPLDRTVQNPYNFNAGESIPTTDGTKFQRLDDARFDNLGTFCLKTSLGDDKNTFVRVLIEQ